MPNSPEHILNPDALEFIPTYKDMNGRDSLKIGNPTLVTPVSCNVISTELSEKLEELSLNGENNEYFDNSKNIEDNEYAKNAYVSLEDQSYSDWDNEEENDKLPFKKCQTTKSDVSSFSKAEISSRTDTKTKNKIREPDPRPHLNVVFIGHVDAGKSTTCGNILVLTGKVDQRTLEKYEKEAKEKNRESWYYAFIVDINEEERQKGKTVEVGRASFELEKTRFTILDAPGHKSFVPNMISGAAQADVAVLIISARKGEFETGFEKGGQTREHAMLSKTLGVSQIIVAINKMDDYTCDWSESRYQEIIKKISPFLKKCGYNLTKDVTFLPISGLLGQNIKLHATDSIFKDAAKAASWYSRDSPTLFDVLDNLKNPERKPTDPLRIPLLEGYKDSSVYAVGKIETGRLVNGSTVLLLPKHINIKIVSILIGEEEVDFANPGENVTIKVSGVTEDQITKGSIISSILHPCPVVTHFKANIMILDLLEHRPIITAGYLCVIHVHTSCEECQIVKLHSVVDNVTKKNKILPSFVKNNSLVVCDIQLAQPICMETYNNVLQLARFSLRDEGKTIGIGKVIEIYKNI